MFQTSRQIMRFAVLSIGFLLFIFVTIRAAQTANNRQAVVGKDLLPITRIATTGSVAAVALATGNTPLSLAITNQSDSKNVAALVQPLTVSQSTHGASNKRGNNGGVDANSHGARKGGQQNLSSYASSTSVMISTHERAKTD